jgi:hypothetical protein
VRQFRARVEVSCCGRMPTPEAGPLRSRPPQAPQAGVDALLNPGVRTRRSSPPLRRLSRLRVAPVSSEKRIGFCVFSVGRTKGESCVILFAVPLRACVVSFTGASGTRYSIEVTAVTLYEAAALGLSQLRKAEWGEVIAPGTKLHVQVKAPAVAHELTVLQVQNWIDATAVTPEDRVRKNRLKALLAG